MTDTSNYADIIDTRDVVARIEELSTELDEVEFPEDELRAEHDQLQGLIEEVRGYSGDTPEDGVTLIRESYFTKYAQEYFDETRDHDSPPDRWPYNHIDWDEAADELRVDYTEVDYDGVPYLFR